MTSTSQIPLIVDCNQCVVRSAAACEDCVVSVLLGPAESTLEFDIDEQAAVQALADSGLVPPLRLVMSQDSQPPHADAS